MPTVSIIMSVYNTEKYLKASLRSVLRQSYDDFELILIDDGSTDNCGSIIDSFAEQDERIRVIHQSNQGCATARNSGLRAAQGRYITFADSDDYMHAAHLELLVRAIEDTRGAHPVDMVLTGEDKVEDGWRGDLDCRLRVKVTPLSQQQLFEGIFNNRRNGYHYAAMWNKLYRRELFQGLSFELTDHEDTVMNTHIATRIKNAVEIHAKTYIWQQRNNSVTRQKRDLRYYNNLTDLYHCLSAIPKEQPQYRALVLRVLYHMIPHCRQITLNNDLRQYLEVKIRNVVPLTLREMLTNRFLPPMERAKLLMWLHWQWIYEKMNDKKK